MYPELFDKLIEHLRRLPGLGEKSAERFAYFLLDQDEEYLEEFGNTLYDLKDKIGFCPVCGFISDKNECELCKDENRDRSKILVVSYSKDVIAIEKTKAYNGLYHVLNGVISSKKGIYPDDLNIEALLKRIDDEVKEVIVATSPTFDGETTALYLDKILGSKGVLVTRLASGLPMGASLDYADELTLIKAMNNRRKFEG